MARRVTCRSCGARNRHDTPRCRICTRPLAADHSPSEKAFDAALYADSVSRRRVARLNSGATLLLVVALAAGTNYMYVGWGPSWTHRASATPAGTSWRTFEGLGHVQALMPGTPLAESASTQLGVAEIREVWVDDHWDAILDSETLAAAQRREAERELFATIHLLRLTTTADPANRLTEVLSSIAPEARLDRVVASEGERDEGRRSFAVDADYTGMPNENSTGVVRARLWLEGGTLYGSVIWFEHDEVDEPLAEKLEASVSFTP